MNKSTGKLCPKHGGNCNSLDAYWLCDKCARAGINPCKCGSPARYFGEALMCSVYCESCDESVAIISDCVDIRQLWNDGYRGFLDDKFKNGQNR